MLCITRHVRHSSTVRQGLSYCFSSLSMPSLRQPARNNATLAVSPQLSLPCIAAPNLHYATQPSHVGHISEQLGRSGILKISLGFADEDSEYLKKLLFSLHHHHGHRLPISHSATRGWFWDVRPSQSDVQAGSPQARSETMNEFPWHTDCSYEDPPPKYFALQVLQHDRCGGGTLSAMNVERLCELLSPQAWSALSVPEYQVTIPPEFIKDATQKRIITSVFTTGFARQTPRIRFREDIVKPLTTRASRGLDELKKALLTDEARAEATIHLKSADLPKGSIILLDNRRWLHARNHIRDPERHLRRVRWDACPFES